MTGPRPWQFGCYLVYLPMVSQFPRPLPNLKLGLKGEVRAVARQPDGKLLIGGAFLEVNGIRRNNIARLNADGSLDTTWNPDADGEVLAIAIDGEFVFVGGRFDRIGGEAKEGLAKVRLTDEGAADSTWGVDVFLWASALQIEVGHDALFVGGDFTSIGGVSQGSVAKLEKNGFGSVDVNWRPSFPNVLGTGTALELVGDSLFVGGHFSSINGIARRKIAKLEAGGTGEVDPEWNPRLDSFSFSVSDIEHADGSIFVVGDIITRLPTHSQWKVAKIDATGSGAIDQNWRGFIPFGGSVAGATVYRNHLYVVGEFSRVGQYTPGSGVEEFLRNDVVRFKIDENGAFDQAWDAGLPDTEAGLGTVLTHEGQVILASPGPLQRASRRSHGIVSYDAATGLADENWQSTVTKPGRVFASVVQADGKRIIAGEFDFAGEMHRRNLLRLTADGELDPWNPNPDGAVLTIALDGNDLYVGGEFSRISEQPIARLAKLGLSGGGTIEVDWDPIAFVPALPKSIRSVILANGNLFAGGHGASEAILLKIAPEGMGEPDAAWSPNVVGTSPGIDSVERLVAAGDSLFLAGHFDEVGGEMRSGLAKISINDTGEVDQLWDPGIDVTSDDVHMAADDSFLYVGGLLNFAFDRQRALFRTPLSGDGTIDPSWVTDIPANGDKVVALLLEDDWIYTAMSREGVLVRRNLLTGAKDPGYQFDYNVVSLGDGAIGGVLAPLRNGVLFGAPFYQLNGTDRWAAAALYELSAPSISVDSSTSRIVIEPSPDDGPEVTHFRITGLSGGTLTLADASSPVTVGDFITRSQGKEGLIFTPTPGAPSQTIAAVSALNPTTDGASEAETVADLSTLSGTTSFRIAQANYQVDESQNFVVVTIEKNGTGAATVELSTAAGTAVPFAFPVLGDFVAQTQAAISFSSVESSKQIPILLQPDTESEGDEVFYVTLSNPGNGAILSGTTRTTVMILDDDFFGILDAELSRTLPSPSAPPTAGGSLTVTLEPAGAGGQWRVEGESTWHNSGNTVNGLATGDYVVEFRPLLGFFHPANQRVSVISPNPKSATGTYVARGAGAVQASATLKVEISPQGVTTPPEVADRGQWRVQGEMNWRESGEARSDLNGGFHIIEFKDTVPGWVAPETQAVEIFGGQTTVIRRDYEVDEDQFGTLPNLLPFGTATGTEPYLYCGQLRTRLGFASGCVVKKNVVLTVAHALFDDREMEYVSEARWLFQRYADEYLPPASEPRAWYLLKGYGAERVGQPPGISTPDSQDRDVASIIFLNDQLPGRGGSAGYLVSDDTTANPWLVGTRTKLLAGYPMQGIAAWDRGKLHAASTATSWTHLYKNVFRSTAVRGFPGMSGAPLFVQHDNGSHYPAAVYLGGTGQTLVRSIDSEVVDLLNRAELAGNGGGNSTGGGDFVAPGVTIDILSRGDVTASSNIADAKWLLRDASVQGVGAALTLPVPQGVEVPMTEGTYLVEFGEVTGFVRPEDAVTEIRARSLAEVRGTYTQTSSSWAQLFFDESELGIPIISGPLGNVDQDETENLLEWAFNLNPKIADSQIMPPGGVKGLPRMMLAGTGSTQRLCIEYIRLKSEAAPGLRYVGEFTSDLETMEEGVEVSVVEVDDRWERVKVEDSVLLNVAQRRFGRVRVFILDDEP